MEKLNIGITANGCYRQVFQFFEDMVGLELFTPWIYGNQQEAVEQRKKYDLKTNFVTLKPGETPMQERLCLINCAPEGETDSGSCPQAQEQLAENLDALVMASSQTQTPQDSMEILICEDIRVAIPATSLSETPQYGKEEDMQVVREEAEKLNTILKRDFSLLRPRIALLTDTPMPSVITTEPAEPHHHSKETPVEEEIPCYTMMINALNEHLCICGPYTAEEMMEKRLYKHIDCVLATNKNVAHELFRQYEQQNGLRYFAHQHIITVPYGPEQQQLNSAIYTAIDICHHRQLYDEAVKNPLPKLFLDKRQEKRINEHIE